MKEKNENLFGPPPVEEEVLELDYNRKFPEEVDTDCFGNTFDWGNIKIEKTKSKPKKSRAKKEIWIDIDLSDL